MKARPLNWRSHCPWRTLWSGVKCCHLAPIYGLEKQVSLYRPQTWSDMLLFDPDPRTEEALSLDMLECGVMWNYPRWSQMTLIPKLENILPWGFLIPDLLNEDNSRSASPGTLRVEAHSKNIPLCELFWR